jgi:hypothetical protein
LTRCSQLKASATKLCSFLSLCCRSDVIPVGRRIAKGECGLGNAIEQGIVWINDVNDEANK